MQRYEKYCLSLHYTLISGYVMNKRSVMSLLRKEKGSSWWRIVVYNMAGMRDWLIHDYNGC